MPNPEIEEFAKLIIQQVRDATIQNCDSRLQPKANDPVAKRWRELNNPGNVESVAKVLIPDIVDSAIWHLLYAIDQGVLPLSFTASNGKTVDLPKDGFGELGGGYMGGDDGWCGRYSQERIVDDFSDLKSRLMDQLRKSGRIE
jgi:hypothetical protein